MPSSAASRRPPSAAPPRASASSQARSPRPVLRGPRPRRLHHRAPRARGLVRPLHCRPARLGRLPQQRRSLPERGHADRRQRRSRLGPRQRHIRALHPWLEDALAPRPTRGRLVRVRGASLRVPDRRRRPELRRPFPVSFTAYCRDAEHPTRKLRRREPHDFRFIPQLTGTTLTLRSPSAKQPRKAPFPGWAVIAIDSPSTLGVLRDLFPEHVTLRFP